MQDLATLTGYYTYRSFLNREQPVDDFNQIKFAEAEVFLRVGQDGAVSGTLAFPAAPASPRQEFMDFTGKVSAWEPLRLRLTGKGRAGSAIADFHYEYDATVLPEWGDAKPPQVLALAGTVIRAKDHGTAKAGVTASFVAVKRPLVEPRDVPGRALIPEAVAMLGSRSHRLRHTAWHTLRNGQIWWHAQMTDQDRQFIKARGWFFDDPPRLPNQSLNLTNGAGEDFLYMHRRMIGMLKDVYTHAGQTPPTGWTSLPATAAPQFAYQEVTDPDPSRPKTYVYDPERSGFMVPPATAEFLSQFPEAQRAGLAFLKTDQFFATVMRPLEGTLRSANVMAQLTLGAYGNLLEFTLHNWMHMRWATVSRDPDDGTVKGRGTFDVDERWDHAKNDYLGDFHSSHVNPIFWKLHGWVDERIEDWFRAHEAAHPGQVKKAVVRGIAWFEKGPWVVKVDPFDWPGSSGHGHGDHGGHGDDADAIRAMVEVIKRLEEVVNRTPTVRAAAAAAPLSSSLLAGDAVDALGFSQLGI